MADLSSMANRASTYRNQGQWKEAEELEVQVMKTRKRVLGGQHPDTLDSMIYVALSYWNLNRWKEAEDLEVQVIETRKRILGKDHPSTQLSIIKLESTYRSLGRLKEAEDLNLLRSASPIDRVVRPMDMHELPLEPEVSREKHRVEINFPGSRKGQRHTEPETSTTKTSLGIWQPFLLCSLIVVLIAFAWNLNFYWKTVSVVISLISLSCIFISQYLPDKYLPLGVFGLSPIVFFLFLLSPVHIYTFTLLDLWTVYAEHPPLEPFSVVYDPGDIAFVDVFAIHGLGSNSSSAWRFRGQESDVDWLVDILPKQKETQHIRVTILNHQTRWDSHAPDMQFAEHANMMLDDIEHINEGKRPIIFIAHSFGGLLLKKILTIAMTRSKHIAEMTSGIMFLGVPHYGTKAAFLASLLSCTAYWRGSSTDLLDYMYEGSSVLVVLDEEFSDFYARRGKMTPYICNFLEMRPERIGRLSLGPTTNRQSGHLRYTANNIYLDADHRGLNKFQSLIDPNFQRFLRHFLRALPKRNDH